MLLMAVILSGIAGPAKAEESSIADQGEGAKKLDITFDITYMSKLMDKGGEYYGQQGGLLETLDLYFRGSGFGVAVGHREATSSGYVNRERFDYALYYGSSLFDDHAYKTNYKLVWVYHDFPDQPRNVGNYYEYVMSLSWDELFPWGIRPFYTMAYETPAGRGYGNRASSGFWHQFGLDCGVKIPGLPGLPSASGEPKDQVCHFSADIAYRDGLGGGAVDHDWSHVTLGVSTAFQITENMSFVPGLYHQISMDDSVAKGDVTYVSLSMKYRY